MNQPSQPDDDILSREKFLNSLAETYLFQDAILNATDLAIFTTNLEGTIISVNPATEKMLGYVSEEMIGRMTPTEFLLGSEIRTRAAQLSQELHTEIPPDFNCLAARYKLQHQEDRFRWTFIARDGKRIPVMLSVSGICNEQGDIISFLGIGTNVTQQEDADEQLRRYQQHLEALIAATDDMAFEVNRKGVYVNVWTKNDQLLFAEREKYVGSSLADILQAPLLSLFQKTIEGVFVSQQNQHLEYAVPGVNQWRYAKVCYIHDDSVLILIRDISERKLAEQLVVESERKFRLLAENLPGTIYLCRNDSLYSMVYLNENVHELTGYTPMEFIKGEISFVQLYHPEDAPRIYEVVDQALSHHQKFEVTYRIHHRDGSWRWIEEHGIGVYENKNLILIEGYLADVTEQKQREQELLQSRNDIQSILVSLDDIVMEITEDGRYQKIWASRPDQLFIPIEGHHGKSVRDLWPEALAIQYEEAIANCLRTGLPYTLEYPSIFPDDTRWFSARFTSIKNKMAGVRSVSVLVQNITERKKFEQDLVLSKSNLETATHELQEQNNQLNEFNQILSHNLRSPVGNISALISFLNDQSTLEDYREIFARLKVTAVNLQETLNELMETVQINRGALAERTNLTFSEVMEKVTQDLAGEIISSHARIEADFSEADQILYSKTYLESILLNLLSNALKYRSPNRPLHIRVKTAIVHGKIQMRVSDNGLGIDLKKYGDQLFGLRKTFHEHKAAKGVGLFLTRTQIKSMGGHIAAESEVNKGTTFIIDF